MHNVASIASAAQAHLPLSLWALLASLVLGMVHIGVSSMLSLAQLGPHYILSARDEQREPVGLAGRVARSYRNFLETFPQFLAAIALVHLSNANADWANIGGWMFVAGRVAYIPAYAFAPPGVRPVCWMFAQTGIVIILLDLFV